jgi:AcrR family transcriptional regulator
MERAEETREKLLEASLELISEKGYIGATTREIATRAGVSELTLFRKFGKKEHLFEEMLKNYSFLPRLKDLIVEVGDLHVGDGLNAIGVHFLETLRERRPLVQILLSEITTYPKKVRSVHQQMIENLGRNLADYFKQRRTHGEVRNVPFDAAAFAFLRILFMTFLHESILKGHEMTDRAIATMVAELVEIFLHGIAVMSEV